MTTLIGGVGGALVFSSASGGKVYAINNLSTTPQVVVAANPSRQKVSFHNPGTVDVLVAPSQVIGSTGAAEALTPTTSARGGCRLVFANGGTLDISGECQGAWQALSVSGSGNPLTVTDSNL